MLIKIGRGFAVFVFLFLSLSTAAATEAQQAQQLQQMQEQQAVDTRFADFFEKLRQNPKDPQLHYALAELYLERDLLELAQVSFRRALVLNPSLAPAHMGLSKLYRKKKLKALEVYEMETAVQIAPDNEDYRYQMGVLYMEPESFDYKKAKKQYEALKKMNSPLAIKLGSLMEIDS
jgi:tetratricopeptide (TPR) repeat protein